MSVLRPPTDRLLAYIEPRQARMPAPHQQIICREAGYTLGIARKNSVFCGNSLGGFHENSIEGIAPECRHAWYGEVRFGPADYLSDPALRRYQPGERPAPTI